MEATSMPTYEYRCSNCEHEMEAFQSIKANPLKKCPACGEKTLQRLVGTGAGVIFKGSGFWETDYKKKSGGESQTAESGSDNGSDSSGQSSGDGSGGGTETKSESSSSSSSSSSDGGSSGGGSSSSGNGGSSGSGSSGSSSHSGSSKNKTDS
jgi:putative FmdB family regulatory protein